VLDKDRFRELQPSVPAAWSPTFGIQPGHAATFLVCTFRTPDGKETWDFGDGSPKAKVRSDGNPVGLARDCSARAVHAFEKPGRYLMRVERTHRRGYTTAGMHVRIGLPPRSNCQPIRPSSTPGPGHFILSP
jgi:hypothetical protein